METRFQTLTELENRLLTGIGCDTIVLDDNEEMRQSIIATEQSMIAGSIGFKRGRAHIRDVFVVILSEKNEDELTLSLESIYNILDDYVYYHPYEEKRGRVVNGNINTVTIITDMGVDIHSSQVEFFKSIGLVIKRTKSYDA